MLRRIPQPKVNPALRDPERHEFWPAFVTALAAFVLLVAGARHVTGVETTSGDGAWETQLIRAFAQGGLRFPQTTPPPPPKPDFSDPQGSALALQRWAQENARREPPTWRVRVDPGAKTPCPT